MTGEAPLPLAGAILAGGLSSRMGTPKEGVLMRDGRAMIEHVADALRPLVATLVISGSSRGFDHSLLGAIRLDDRRPGLGPLAAIEAILHSGIAHHYLIACCDQPLLTTELLRTLLPPGEKAIALKCDDGAPLLPFPCLLPASFAVSCTHALDAGERSLRRWLLAGQPLLRTAPPGSELLVRSANTREELRDLEASGPGIAIPNGESR